MTTIDTLITRRLRPILILSLLLIDLPYIAYALYIVITHRSYSTNYKIFFPAVDAALLSLFSIIGTVYFLTQPFTLPKTYRKYIIEGVSNQSLPALSEPAAEEPLDNEEDEDGLHRSNSTGQINIES